MPVVCRACGGPDLWPALLLWQAAYRGDTLDGDQTPAERLKQVLVQARLEAVRLGPIVAANGTPMD